MILTHSQSKQRLFGLVLLLVLVSNFIIYRLPAMPIPADSSGVVLGSLLDLAIVAPLLILAMTRNKGFTIKRFITFMVLGLVAARFIIPATYFEPFKFIPYIAIGIEGLIVLAEMGLIILLMKHLPAIVGEIKNDQVSSLFAFPVMVKEKVSTHPLITMIAAETLMFYYAFATWKQQPLIGESRFYLHQKTSLIAFNVMLIHAIVIETLGFHWWLHDKSMVLSIVLLVLNVYSVIYFIADIQTVRLNPLTLDENHMRISLGLSKRMEIPYTAIDRIDWGEKASMCNLKEEGIIDFIARDFEVVKPQCVIHFKRPLKAMLFLGREKEFVAAAIRVDEPESFQRSLEQKLDN
ncbi:beta-carotene 15,15'-monooxygenase [Sporosarcina limicola]|uniref:Accessory gene regulator protein AgrB n=1 Tax=Sporosarcina limicola TaxID=34101 RepID=A0A927MFS4_9BACL|nr:beta-carotene 15,15'-monooxygenase [Sporosarcina limicola]MBE1552936.1 accessory gene regulator protein AgrB [Sporosarcina limicola]